jgi:hypothetical protein
MNAPQLLAILAVSLTVAACDSSQPDAASATGSTPAVAPEAATAGTSGNSEIRAECRPASDDCPPENTDGDGVTTTDSLPLGSTMRRDDGGSTVEESDYPTSPGSGNAGSGVTGVPSGPAPGPAMGIGR